MSAHWFAWTRRSPTSSALSGAAFLRFRPEEAPMADDSENRLPDAEIQVPPPAEPRQERPEVPRGVHAMALFRWALVLVMAVVALGSVAHSFGMLSSDSASAAAGLYHCPMHPQVVQDHPGECPICGMTLVKFEDPKAAAKAAPSGEPKKPDSHAGHRHNPRDPYACPMHPEETGLDAKARCPICGMYLEKREPRDVPGLVPVELSLDRVQLIGIRTEPARSEALLSELKTVGFVAADEARLARVHTRFSGWIERLAVGTTGQKVHRGQVLAALYNLELLPAQQEFLAARRWATRSETQSDASGLGAGRLEEDARARLELFGLSPAEIDSIAKSGQPTRTVAVTAPIGGYVTRKNAVQGTYVQPGTELFEIADLSKVWLLADIYEHEIGRISVGQTATVTVSAYPKTAFVGKVGFIYPALDPGTRTLRVRVELTNKDFNLRPGMFGDVVIQLAAQSGVVIPVEALVDTGEVQYVFLAKEGGRFEPRRVQAGARAGDKVEILSGLAAGETVVTTANFLIDSESRLRAAIQAPSQPDTPPHSH
ncbi:MAG TPA: efflux RND transporter periplasmic adaptor subunit [Polyangiaceae bacterium]|nr:efflux RND transporter periplasmic adaptor subunit [Polyangiaceae bacterium]